MRTIISVGQLLAIHNRCHRDGVQEDSCGLLAAATQHTEGHPSPRVLFYNCPSLIVSKQPVGGFLLLLLCCNPPLRYVFLPFSEVISEIGEEKDM